MTVSQAGAPQKIVLLGDSLGASYGVPLEQGWVRLLNASLLQDNVNWQMINASISGETTAGGLARLESVLQREQPQWLLIELGGNDGLRGLDLQAMKSNLLAMIKLSREHGVQPALAGILLPPNFGRKYRERFDQIYADVSHEQNVPLLPFLLDGVGGIDQFMQDDRIHPNAQAQPFIADTVKKFLLPLLGQTAAVQTQ